MTTLTFEAPAPGSVWPQHGLAIGTALVLHLGLGLLLLQLSSGTPPSVPVATVIKTQLLALPALAQVSEPAPAPEPVAQPQPAAPAPAPALAPAQPARVARAEPPARVQQAYLALKRAEQQRKEQARVVEQQVRQQQQERTAQENRERAAREQQQARSAEAAHQASVAAAADAAAAAQAQAQAASSQYLPIDKQAPDYPATALERRIQGECTVAYTVDAQGRVQDPQVIGTCHPLFIKPSLAAARTFRYQPRVVNGQAVAVANVKNTFTYRIR